MSLAPSGAVDEKHNKTGEKWARELENRKKTPCRETGGCQKIDSSTERRRRKKAVGVVFPEQLLHENRAALGREGQGAEREE